MRAQDQIKAILENQSAEGRLSLVTAFHQPEPTLGGSNIIGHHRTAVSPEPWRYLS